MKRKITAGKRASASITHLLFGCCALLVFASCGGPIESFSFKSPDGDRSIDVSGKRESPAGPIIVAVKLNVPAGSETFTFEHQAGSLTQKNVSADWVSNVRCNLTFKFDDGNSWVVETYLMDDKVQAIKRFNIDGKTIFD